MNDTKGIAWSAFALIAALFVVGTASDGIARHLVQSAPAWIAVVLGARGSPAAKWAGLPVFAFWLLIFALIWLYLLGLAHVVTGHFGATEIVMTILGGTACIAGAVGALQVKSGVRWWRAALILIVVAGLQIGAMWLSLNTPLVSDTRLNTWFTEWANA